MNDSYESLVREQRGEPPHVPSPDELDVRYEKLKQVDNSVMDRKTFNQLHPVKGATTAERIGHGLLAGILVPHMVVLSTKMGATIAATTVVAICIAHHKKFPLTEKALTYGVATAWGGWTAYCVGSNLMDNEKPLMENDRIINYDAYLSRREEKIWPSGHHFQNKASETAVARPSEVQR